MTQLSLDFTKKNETVWRDTSKPERIVIKMSDSDRLIRFPSFEELASFVAQRKLGKTNFS